MKIRVAILAAAIGLLALAQTNLAQAAYAGSDPDRQPSKLNAMASFETDPLPTLGSGSF